MKFLAVIFLSLFLIACAGPGAIGVAYNQKGVVRHVFPNSPAERAGILIGDRIRNSKELRGPIGTTCTVKIEREGTFIELLVERVDVEQLQNNPYSTW